jgi:hypothetical protein
VVFLACLVGVWAPLVIQYLIWGNPSIDEEIEALHEIQCHYETIWDGEEER